MNHHNKQFTDRAMYYYMLGDEMVSLDGIEEVYPILTEEVKQTGLTPEDLQQIWELMVEGMIENRQYRQVQKIRKKLVNNEQYGLCEEWGDYHYSHNLDTLALKLHEATVYRIPYAVGNHPTKILVGIDKSYKKLQKTYHNVKNLLRVNADGANKDSWSEFVKAYQLYQQLTGREMFICLTWGDTMALDEVEEDEVFKHLTKQAVFKSKWGEEYKQSKFYRFGDVITLLSKENNQQLFNLGYYGFVRYMWLLRDSEDVISTKYV